MGIGLVLDSNDPEKLAEFWAPALGYANLGQMGNYVVLVDGEHGGPNLLLQRVDEPKVGKNRMHFDIHDSEVDARVSKLEGLGARRLHGPYDETGVRWFVLADPEGNEFCVCNGGA